jgi:endonuclease YncB( thermonuclease family)
METLPDQLLLTTLGCTLKDFSLDGSVVWARVVEVYDGDTFRAVFRLPVAGGPIVKMKCRVLGINAPEIKPRLLVVDRETVMYRARQARDRLCLLVTGSPYSSSIDNDNILLVSMRCGPFDKYGRLLVKVTCPGGDDVASVLLKENLAIPMKHKQR